MTRKQTTSNGVSRSGTTRKSDSHDDNGDGSGVFVTEQRVLTDRKYRNVSHDDSDEGRARCVGGSARGSVVVDGVNTVADVWKDVFSHASVQRRFMRVIEAERERVRAGLDEELGVTGEVSVPAFAARYEPSRENPTGFAQVVRELESSVAQSRGCVSERQVSDAFERVLRDEHGVENRVGKAAYVDLIANAARPGENRFFLFELLSSVRFAGRGRGRTSDVFAFAELLTSDVLDEEDERVRDGNGGRDELVVTVGFDRDEFTDRFEREQQALVLELVNVLASQFTVRLTGVRSASVTRAWLRDQFRDTVTELRPGSGERGHGRTGDGERDGDELVSDERVGELVRALEPGETPIAVLRELCGVAGGVYTYSELYSVVERGDSTVRSAANELQDLGLVDVYGPRGGKKVSVLPVGELVRSEFDRVHGEQISFDDTDLLEESGHSSTSTSTSDTGDRVTENDGSGECERDVCVAAESEHVTGDDHSKREDDEFYETCWMGRASHDAVMSCAVTGGEDVVVVDSPVTGVSGKKRFVSVDSDAEEVIVSSHATNPFDYVVGSAVTLSSAKFIDEALGLDGFENVLRDVPAPVLRNARHIGYLTDDVLGDAEAFRDMLVSWGEDVEELTRMLRDGEYGEYDSRGAFVSRVMRDAHGLAGSVVHLLDAAGVDVVRDVRVPAAVNSRKLSELSKSMVHAMLIQSGYGSFTAYRQLFEERAEKRAFSFTADVDAANPFGSLVGSFVVRGGSAERLRDMLIARLERRDGDEVHEDAPEFQVPVPVRDAGRREVAVACSRVLNRKGLRATRGAVSVLDAVLQSPFEVARALEWLGVEERRRVIRADEVRFVLQRVPEEWLLSGCAPSVGDVFAVLVEEEWVSQSELCSLAGVSAQTLRNHREWLEASGLVRVRESGAGLGVEWRAALSFRSGEERERGVDVYPVAVQSRSCGAGVGVGVSGAGDVFEALRSRGSGAGDRGVSAGDGFGVDVTGGGARCDVVEVVVGCRVEQVAVSDVPGVSVDDGDGAGEGVTAGVIESTDEHEHVDEREAEGEEVVVSVSDFDGVSIPGSMVEQ